MLGIKSTVQKMHSAFFMPKNNTPRKENTMKERLDKLLTVKSIVTLLLAVIFAVLSIRGTISGQEFLTVFTVVISFYFGTQKVKEDKME